MVGKKLERNDVDDSLECVGSVWDANSSVVLEEGRVVVIVADHDRVALSGCHLLEGTFSVLRD